jgi:dihydrofolate synthase/folylpolyglutamate synthase
MHASDLKHSNKTLQQKLETLFALRQGSKVNWDRTDYLDLLRQFGNDHLRLPPVIHVAGTNGKGSIIATLRAILEAQGYRVHAYTSPHLISVNERIYLCGRYISDEELEALIDEIWPIVSGKPFSFFEIMTAIALRAFAQNPADVLLLEVGCGGRLDCTNVIDKPLACIISRISMDHTEYLGDTFAKIAAEKAGIMKRGVPCIIGYQGEGPVKQEILDVMRASAKETGVQTLIFAEDWNCKSQGREMDFSIHAAHTKLPLPNLLGEHQIWNAGAALMALTAVREYLPVSEGAIIKGLQNISWPGRLQRIPAEKFGLQDGFEIWLDSGHNDSAGLVLARQVQAWRREDPKPVYLIVGMLGAKNISQFLEPLAPFIKEIRVVPVPGEKNVKTVKDVGLPVSMCKIMSSAGYLEAISEIQAHSGEGKGLGGRILIVGSLYLAGEVLRYLGRND